MSDQPNEVTVEELAYRIIQLCHEYRYADSSKPKPDPVKLLADIELTCIPFIEDEIDCRSIPR